MLLEARSVSAGYGRTRIVHDASCRIAGGRVVALVGPNGSGKSTLLRSLARALPPQRGGVFLDGENLYDLTPRAAAARLAYVPQDSAVGFDFTVGELVALGAEAALPPRGGAPAARERTARALRDLDLEALAGRSLITLSGGERQRAFVARALAQNPDLLLLDEPTAHLDLRHQQDLFRVLQAAARRHGRAILIVLHDLNLAAGFADEMLLLHQGRIAAAGDPAAVITPERLGAVSGADVSVLRAPLTGRPWVLARPASYPQTREDTAAPGFVHVLCGGGAGAEALAALRAAGVPVTAGILSAQDPDAAAAGALGISYTPIAPFTPIGERELRADAERRRRARHVVVTPLPIGAGNVALLRAAAECLVRGQSVLLLAPPGEDVAARDHTGDGEGARLWRLLEERARIVRGMDDLLAAAVQ